MKIIKKSETIAYAHEASCTAYEYPLDFKDVNFATSKITGRYPSKGVTMNEICKEFLYVVRGDGKININGKDIQLQQGDLACIEPGEKYYFEGQMELFMPCAPAWTPEQYKTFE